MAQLITAPNLSNPDDIYERLVRLHDGLSEAESLKTWSRLVLALINHIGDPEVIGEAIAISRQTGPQSRQS
ncbi:Protein of unknown function (DUF2783) [Chelatococcus sambhunathii]|uniref:DUF2783 domain-containing protein n=2 Tax=Chelatococcus TaxID=28209 RepID=A0AAC9NZJ1_9HYPH|nr:MULTISPECIES: DUF2783 domain-containing protein [Chelatococcus]APF37656.1 hypothetical protein BOQ54_10230 [Chelatococcus daeguensis]CUA85840.1 Protein of unknown function (DUF2783) [Chelatococcus sambhunathii]